MNNLRKYRKSIHFTQKDVADAVGCSRESYIRYESKDDMPPLDVADSIARLFSVTFYELWPDLSSIVDYRFSLKTSYLDGCDDTFDKLAGFQVSEG